MKTKLVLTKAYKLLGKLCYDQKKMQTFLMKYFDYFICHMEDERDIPVYFLLTEMYRENKIILKDKKQI